MCNVLPPCKECAIYQDRFYQPWTYQLQWDMLFMFIADFGRLFIGSGQNMPWYMLLQGTLFSITVANLVSLHSRRDQWRIVSCSLISEVPLECNKKADCRFTTNGFISSEMSHCHLTQRITVFEKMAALPVQRKLFQFTRLLDIHIYG